MWELSQKHKAKIWAISCGELWNDKMPEDISTLQWLKFGYHIEDNEIRDMVMKELVAKECFEISNSSPVNIEVNA
jgi:hypothetical protein